MAKNKRKKRKIKINIVTNPDIRKLNQYDLIKDTTSVHMMYNLTKSQHYSPRYSHFADSVSNHSNLSLT